MKKVVLSAYACSPYKGSEYCVGWSWAVGLAKKGLEVWCVTNVEDIEDCLKEKKALEIQNLHFVSVELYAFADKNWLNNSKKVIYLHYFLWKRKASKIIKELHEKHQFDIAHHVSYGSFQQGSSLYRLGDCKIIFGPVGGGQMSLPIFKPYFGSSWGIEIIRKYMSKFLVHFNSSLTRTLKKADVVLMVNQETQTLYESTKYYKEGKSFYVSDSALPVQFEQNQFKEKDTNEEFRILWVGRLIPRRGLELSLKALSYVSADVNYKLVIVGDGEQGPKVSEWIKKYKLDRSKIEHLGWVPYSQMHEEYERADVMLFCPLRDTAGLQATEAMGFGLPIITMNISGMRTIVTDECGIKIDPTTTDGTAKDIGNAIEFMYNNPEFRKKAARKAYDRAMENTWANKIERVTTEFY
ncbi:glycosyltransferase involved in cell wall biosynthesis [Flavobacteriaceae bacterium MAR_2009_75]|nr:glycosyltransferase involved in cell wall biosynthesis [Flavobacteriaceae bacterium MAR_2009_75]